MPREPGQEVGGPRPHAGIIVAEQVEKAGELGEDRLVRLKGRPPPVG
ncbi:hypothetical protein [Streptomyces sp. TLI_105]|nr:hypothetical protein [Streptomyces sp. TLI_105]